VTRACLTVFWRAPQNIIRSYRQAGLLAVQRLRELSVDIGTDDKARQRDMMVKCAMTSMNSKLVRLSTLQTLRRTLMQHICVQIVQSTPDPEACT
jgi:chaperonin GroEL (HSP60 family)